jgi:hypothetical protein
VNFLTGENVVIRYSKDKNIFVITVLSHAMHTLRSKYHEIRATVCWNRLWPFSHPFFKSHHSKSSSVSHDTITILL